MDLRKEIYNLDGYYSKNVIKLINLQSRKKPAIF